MCRPLIVAALLLVGTFAATSSYAQGAAEEDNQFDDNVKKGLEAYKDRRYNAAIKHFRDAYGIKSDPTLIFNIAKSYERLGKLDDAIANYQAYVDAPGTTAEDRADALSRIKALRQEQAARDAAARDLEPPAPTLPPERTEKTTPLPLPRETTPKKQENNAVTSAPKIAGPMVIVVHRANAIVSVSKEQVQDIYFGRMTVWPNGTRIRPYSRPRNSAAASVFFGPATGIDAVRYARQWQQKQLSGTAMAPGVVDTASGVLKTVAANEGAIGYLLPGEVPASVDGVRLIELR